MRQVIFTILLFSFNLALHAQTNNFWATINDQWDEPGNWSLNVVPGPGDHARISGSTIHAVIPSGYTADVAYFTIENDAILTIEAEGSLEYTSSVSVIDRGTLINDGYFGNFGLIIYPDGIVTNNGTIEIIESSEVKFNNHGTITNNGSINSDENSENVILIRNFNNSSTFYNYGTINKSNISRLLYNSGTFINYPGGEIYSTSIQHSAGAALAQVFNTGTIENHSIFEVGVDPADPDGIVHDGYEGRSNSLFHNKPGATWTMTSHTNLAFWLQASTADVINEGMMEFEGLSNVNYMILGWGDLDNSGGTLKGTGRFSTVFYTNTGTVSPGNSIGELYNTEGEDFTAATYDCEIEGTAGSGVAGGNDLYRVSDEITLGGTLNVSLLSGFEPVENDIFTIMESVGNNITGAFDNVNTPSLPGDLYWEVIYNNNNVQLEVRTNAPLPIELVEFELKNLRDIHLLNWVTASEINGSHFEIQYSTDTRDWEILGTIAAIGESITPNEYNFEHHPGRLNNIHYYRLKMIDLDGSFSFSLIRSVESQDEFTLQIAPNPFDDHIQIHTSGDFFEIIDSRGAVVVQSAASDESINLAHLPSGMYVVKAYKGQRTIVNKILKPRK